MGLEYKTTKSFPIFGTISYTYANDSTTVTAATRTSWNLTTSYQTETGTQPTKSFRTAGYSKLNLNVLYTMGATETTNSIELKIESSDDGINFYRIPNETVSGGTSTLAAREFTFVGSDAAAATISIGLDIFYKFLKISAKETGVITNAGTVYCEATLAGL